MLFFVNFNFSSSPSSYYIAGNIIRFLQNFLYIVIWPHKFLTEFITGVNFMGFHTTFSLMYSTVCNLLKIVCKYDLMMV
jgi:hypothetical protein